MQTNTTKNIITLEGFNKAIAPRRYDATADNLRIVTKLANNGCTIADVEAFTKTAEYQTITGHVLRKFASRFYAANGKPEKAPKEEEPKTPETPKTPAPANNATADPLTLDEEKAKAAENLRRAFESFLGGNQNAVVDMATIEKLISEKVNAAMKAIRPSMIEVKIGDIIRPVEGTAHYMLSDVLTDLTCGEPAYLFGPAGTGKTVLAQQAAEALGVPFYFTSKIDEVFQLTGFIDANGSYHETELYRCMQTGGVFLFDEMDASSSEALTAFNALLANGIMDFPTGKIKKPENMYIIGAGNTNGQGGTSEYNTRQKIDAATLDRFIVEKIGYDPKIEDAIGKSFADQKMGADAVDVVRIMRKFSERNGLEIIASYRTIKRLGKLAALKGVAKTVMSCIENTVSADDYESLKADPAMKKAAAAGNVFAAAICG